MVNRVWNTPRSAPLMIRVLLVSLISRTLETTTHAAEPLRSNQTKAEDTKPELLIVLLKGARNWTFIFEHAIGPT